MTTSQRNTPWFAVPAGTGADVVGAAVLTAGGEAVRVALGNPGVGLTGFRRSHRQAQQARRVALAAGGHAGRVVSFADACVVALLCEDLDATRTWVADTLGALADDDENAGRLRETARVFLAVGSSHTAAGELLWVEGQGSLLHPVYSGVALGLYHGSVPHLLVLCHEAGRSEIEGAGGGPHPIPPLRELVELHERLALPARPARVAAIALNTRALDDDEAQAAVASAEEETGLPADDPVRFGAAKLVDAVLAAVP